MMEKDEYYQDGIKPSIFKNLIGGDHKEFKTAKQQDTREYFDFILDKIMKAEKVAKAGNPGEIFDFTLEKRI